MKQWNRGRAGALLLAAALGLGVAGIGAGVAQATGGKPSRLVPICSVWQARGATGAYPDVTFGGKPDRTIVGRDVARLSKPAGDVVAPGVEFATRDLGVEVTEETTVRARFVLSHGAKSDAGAVRMFGYETANADTLSAAPSWTSVASQQAGTFSFTVPAGKKIGTLGFAYDASNDTRGMLSVADVRVGKRPVQFRLCPKPSASASSSSSASASSSSSASASVSVSPSTTRPASSSPTATVPATSDPTEAAVPSLPVTGPGAPPLAGAAGALLLGGGVLVWAMRRRRMSFEA